MVVHLVLTYKVNEFEKACVKFLLMLIAHQTCKVLSDFERI